MEQKSKYTPKVLKSAPTESKIFPLVIVQNPRIIIDEETLSYTEQKYIFKIEIEIYATEKTVGIKKIARQTIMEELENLIYEVFEGYYKFKGLEPQVRPNADINVSREAIQFEGRIKNNIIYRR